MSWLKKITVEPAMFLQQAGDTLTYVIFQNLFIDKICKVQLNYDESVCKLYESVDNDLSPAQQFLVPIMNQIQEKSSTFVLYNSLVENSLPVFLVLFLGVWSDATRKRKPCLLLSLVGKLCRSLGLLLNAYFLNWHPIVLLFTVSLPHSIGGANGVFQMAAFSYIADCSVPRSRTLRLGIAEAFWQLGSPVGLFLGQYLFLKGGYLCVFSTAVCIHLTAVLYTAFLLPEVPQPRNSQYSIGKYGYGACGSVADFAPQRNRCFSENNKGEFESGSEDADSLLKFQGSNSNYLQDTPTATAPPMGQGQGQQYHQQSLAIRDQQQEEQNTSIVDISGIKDFLMGSLNAIIKERPNHIRKCLLSLGFIMLLYGILLHGETNMKYLFTRNRFQWREQQFSYWTAFDSLMFVVGLTIFLPIFSKLLRLSDPFSGGIAAFGRAISRLCIGFAPSAEYLYLGSILDVTGIIGPLSARSLASKCVLRDERGKVFAFLGCIEALVPLIAVPLYSMIYSNTLTYAPSAIYYVSAALCLINFAIFSILFVSAKLKIVDLSGTDTSSLTNPQERPEGDNIYDTYRRFSLS